MTKPNLVSFVRRFRLPSLAAVVAVTAAVAVAGAPGPATAQALATQPPAARVAAPLSLTASDGAGLDLVSLSADAVVEDPLAFTELHLVFRNPENRVREGRFRITLPSGATVSRFAMRVGDRWQEGEVVEQQAARVAYEDFLHRRQDPALLEAEAGNEFSARVFPIPPNATKELIVSYSQELAVASQPYRLPLVGLPRLGQLSIRVQVGKAAAATSGTAPARASSLGGARAQVEVVEVQKRDFKPDRDFEVAHAGVAGRIGLRNDNLLVARIAPLGEASRRDTVASLSVLVDTSASRALGLGDQLAALEGLMAELKKAGDPVVSVAAFDQEVAPIYTGKASGMGDSVRKRLTERRALGASDLDGALAWLAGASTATSTMTAAKGIAKAERRARVLLVTDGVATAGETGADKLRARVKALAAVGVERLDVLAVGGIRDDALLTRLVTAGLARDGVVLDGTQPAATLAGRLTRATRSGLKVEVEGATWLWPSVLDGVQPGDETLIYADLPANQPLRIKVDGRPLTVAGGLAPVERPLIERAWVKARLARLAEMRDAPEKLAGIDRDMSDALKKQMIELSTKYRVLCPFTSLLVLETEQDYARFGIERRALADILTVGPGGIALLHRSDFGPAPMMAIAATGVASGDEQTPGDKSLSAVARPQALRKEEAKRRLRAPQAEAAMEMESDAAEVMQSRSRRDTSDGPLGAAGNGLANRGGDGRSVSGFGALRASPVAGAPTAAPAMAAPAMTAAAPPPPAPPAAQADRLLAAKAAKRSLDDILEGGSAGRAASADRPREAARATAHHGRGVYAPVPSPEPAYESFPQPSVAPVTGPLKEVLESIRRGDARGALAKALAWRDRDPGDVLALIALGECWEAQKDSARAARAYGSIIDLFPGRADLRRFAGERLERVRGAAALALAVDTYRKAVEQRPDHPAGHRLLGFALLKQGHPREAFDAIAVGAARSYPAGRFRGVEQILREDLGLAAAAWTRAEPARADEIRARLARAGGTAETTPSLRFVLNWETDANDVDFHIHDAKGGHAFYSAPHLPSGGDLYADVTTGYGPECFTIRGAAAARANVMPYHLQAHYYSRGPMGYGMGKLQIIEHDGKGGLRFDERPFVIMEDGAFVDLGNVTAAVAPVRTAVLAR